MIPKEPFPARLVFAEPHHPPFVPADAGTQPLPNRTTFNLGKDWIPASAGMTGSVIAVGHRSHFMIQSKPEGLRRMFDQAPA